MKSVMLLFDIVVLIFGIYMIGAGLKMKKTGEISSAVITAEEIAKCRDKKGFIAFIYWKEAIFGGVVALVGVLGIVNEAIVSLGVLNIIEMIVFFATFIWFQIQLRTARKKYICS